MPFSNMSRGALEQRSRQRTDDYYADQEAALDPQFANSPFGQVGAINALRAEAGMQRTRAIGNQWDPWLEAVKEAEESAQARGLKFGGLRAGPSPEGSNQLTGFSAQPYLTGLRSSMRGQ